MTWQTTCPAKRRSWPRYQSVAWGPSNTNDQQNADVQADVALAALNDQMQYDVPQGQYPGDYWTLATGLGDDVIQGNLTSDTSDDDLMAALQTFQDTCISYASAAVSSIQYQRPENRLRAGREILCRPLY
jgi:hypothetical protein